jgi:UDP-N-acetylglucosamine:LPS N-acetylglucosamine transferase
MKICLECADGGHLDEMLSILDAFDEHAVFFVTFNTMTTKELPKVAKTLYIKNFKGAIDPVKLPKPAFWLYTILYLVRRVIPCFIILRKERPDVIISTGGGVTIPLCYLGKLLGVKIIYIESMARINQPSGTGRFIHPIADLFLVQWESMLKFYRKAKYWGRVI